MKTICLYFQIHQPYRLKPYRFFNIGSDHHYYNRYLNEEVFTRIARDSFIPANKMLLDLINKYDGQVKVAFSISGTSLDQMEIYSPETLDSFRALAETGCVEFLAETYSHSMASLKNQKEFEIQVKEHSDKLQMLFAIDRPTVFRNSELIYSDDIGEMVHAMGYKKMLTEGAKYVLGWKSPNYLYRSAQTPDLKLLLKNYRLTDDIVFRFSDYGWKESPLTADKYIDWIYSTPKEEEVINIFMNYETLGSTQPAGTGIFEFFKALPQYAFEKGITFSTPSEVFNSLESIGEISAPHPISWADEERDISSWLGNNLQKSAFDTLYSIAERVRMTDDKSLLVDWEYLQTTDHFYYMSTKHFTDGTEHNNYSPYSSPYDAFNNYMNVLSDFMQRVKSKFPSNVDNEELHSLITTIRNQGKEITKLKTELKNAKATKTTRQKKEVQNRE